ncbi:MAG TPA: tetratricopeptide repeat protein, partial [Halanaerobiales bacterium]|nr:tetratricopeptide repeat protein [Halanaerobiales bacterium]
MLKNCSILVFIILFLFVSGLNAQDNNKLLEGIAHYYEGSYQEAIRSFGEILGDDQANIDALYYQTLAYLEEHNVIEARNNIKQMEETGYQFGLIHWKLGSLYLNTDGYYDSAFYNEARKELEKSQELGISTSGFHSDLAMAYQGLGNLEKAVTEYEIAIEKGAEAEVYINLANLYQQTGKISEAMEIYELAIKENHENIS